MTIIQRPLQEWMRAIDENRETHGTRECRTIPGRDFQKRLTALLTRANLPFTHPDAPSHYERILRALQLDKKFCD